MPRSSASSKKSMKLPDLPDDVLTKIVGNLAKDGRERVKLVNRELKRIAIRADHDSPVSSPKAPSDSWQVGEGKRYHVKLPGYQYIEFGVWESYLEDEDEYDFSNIMYEATTTAKGGKDPETLFRIVPISHKHYPLYQIIVSNIDFYNNPQWIKMIIQEVFARNKNNELYPVKVYQPINTSAVVPDLNVMIALHERKQRPRKTKSSSK